MADEADFMVQYRKILTLLSEAEIRFVLIGGLAMILQGSNTFTSDIDITFAMDSENLERLTECINQLHPRPIGVFDNPSFAVSADIIHRWRFVLLKTDLGGIDLLKSPQGIDSFEGLYERASILDMGGFEVHVASVDDLIAMKKTANRPKDQGHLLELLALKKLSEESGS
ncbi:MAG: nucleotidyl transferase AbiEii/AbiGii toxin family protein [Armatimonas sp.]